MHIQFMYPHIYIFTYTYHLFFVFATQHYFNSAEKTAEFLVVQPRQNSQNGGHILNKKENSTERVSQILVVINNKIEHIISIKMEQFFS